MNCSVPGCTRAAWGKKPQCFNHTVPSREILKRVYRAVREMPGASLREIGEIVGCVPSTVNRALYELDRIGAVRKPPRNVARGLVVLPTVIYDDQPYAAVWIDP